MHGTLAKKSKPGHDSNFRRLSSSATAWSATETRGTGLSEQQGGQIVRPRPHTHNVSVNIVVYVIVVSINEPGWNQNRLSVFIGSGSAPPPSIKNSGLGQEELRARQSREKGALLHPSEVLDPP